MHYITTAQAAELFGVTPRRIRDWLKSGKLRGINPGGGKWLVEMDETDRAAQGLDGCTAHEGDVLISSTLEGEFTWIK